MSWLFIYLLIYFCLPHHQEQILVFSIVGLLEELVIILGAFLVLLP
jgi:hypothetical protein